MPLPRPVAAALLAAAAAGAQSNPFIIFPQDPERMTITSATYTGRPDWNNAAEGFQELAAEWFRGIGDLGGGCLIDGFYHWAADENGSTPETYGIVLRSAQPNGQLDPTPAGVIVRIAGLTTPVGAAVRSSFIMSDVFATPVVVPCAQTWFQGLDFPANPNWPATDGHGLWRADLPGFTTTIGENPRPFARRTTWALTAAGTTISTGWTYIMGVRAAAPMLHLGGIDPTSARTGVLGAPSYGLNGLFPGINGTPRADGLNLRIQDNAHPAGIAFAAIAVNYLPAPVLIPSMAGELFLDPAALTTVGFASMVGGAAVLPVAAPGTIPPAFVGFVFLFQGVVIDPVTGFGAFTNTQATVF